MVEIRGPSVAYVVAWKAEYVLTARDALMLARTLEKEAARHEAGSRAHIVHMRAASEQRKLVAALLFNAAQMRRAIRCVKAGHPPVDLTLPSIEHAEWRWNMLGNVAA